MINKESIEKVNALVNDILQQCENKGFTILEVEMLPNAILRKTEELNEQRIALEVFKRI